jgi:hypothetical protein
LNRLCLLATATLFCASAAHANDPKASSLLHEAIEAQGGEAALRAIRTLQWQSKGYRNALEQSERPEGPYVTEFTSVTAV